MNNIIRNIRFTPQRSFIFDYLLHGFTDNNITMKGFLNTVEHILADFIIAFKLKAPTKEKIEFVLSEDGEYFSYKYVSAKKVAIEIRLALFLLESDTQVIDVCYLQDFEITQRYQTPVSNPHMAFETGFQLIHLMYQDNEINELLKNYIFSKQLLPALQAQFEKILFSDMQFILNIVFSKTQKERKTKIHLYSKQKKIGELDVHSFNNRYKIVPILLKQPPGKRYYVVDEKTIQQSDVAIAAYFPHPV